MAISVFESPLANQANEPLIPRSGLSVVLTSARSINSPSEAEDAERPPGSTEIPAVNQACEKKESGGP